MTELDHILGFDSQIAFLTDRFLNDRVKRLVVRGPSGVGKSTLVKSVARNVEAAGQEVIWLRGDPGRTGESYFPIRAALQPGTFSRFFDRGIRLAEGLVGDFLPMGKATAKALIALLPHGKTRQDIAALQASEVSREFFAHLVRALKSRRVLLVADDIQYFDLNTLQFLNDLFDLQGLGIASEGSISLLSVLNDDITPEETKLNAIEKLTSTLTSISINHCSEIQYGAVLKSFGLSVELSPDIIKTLYECSGGHLHIARFICDELRFLPMLEMNSTVYADLTQFVIQRRLEQLPLEHDTLAELLSSAAFIGRTFTCQELACLTGIDVIDIRQALRAAEALRFIDRDGEQVQFTHEIMRSYFLRFALRQKSKFSAKYADCLRILRPAEYFVRSITLLDADDVAAATVAYCQGLISQWRSGLTERKHIADHASNGVSLNLATEAYLDMMRRAHVLLARGDFRATCTLLDASQDAVEARLLAEKDYLRAEALLKNLGASSTGEAARILNEWTDLKNQEPELWCRMQLLLLLAHVQLQQYSELKQTERDIIMFLSARAQFDRSAERQLHRLLAISEMHSSAEIARKRIDQACAFYERKFREEGFSDFYEYFICLTNRSGNAITNAVFPAAINAGCQALTLCRDYSMISFPAQWAAANNVIIAAVLDGQTTASDAIECLQELVRRFPDMDDDVLIQSNIGALAILSGDLSTALEFFDANTRRFESTPDIDPYYLYLSDSNRAIALQLSGLPSARQVWDACEPLIARLAPAIRHELKARHDAVSDFFEVTVSEFPTMWNTERSEIARAHPRYRSERFPQGVFLSDIQIWSSF